METKPLSEREIEIMKEVGVTMRDIKEDEPSEGKCVKCEVEPNVPGMWVCEKCYDKRSN